MRCDGEPVRLGMRTTRQMSRASQPDKQNGTLSVHTIKASGHVRRSNRPNTRLHPTTTQTIKSTLAMREPSTQDMAVALAAHLTDQESGYPPPRTQARERCRPRSQDEVSSNEPAFAGQAAFSISATRAGIALFIIWTAFSRRRLYRSPPSEISDGARARNESLIHWERYSMRG